LKRLEADTLLKVDVATRRHVGLFPSQLWGTREEYKVSTNTKEAFAVSHLFGVDVEVKQAGPIGAWRQLISQWRQQQKQRQPVV
jgi:hypothetical protein